MNELSSGYDYVGAGNSTTKKDAQSNAAKDFIQFLLRRGEMRQEDLPQSLDSSGQVQETAKYHHMDSSSSGINTQSSSLLQS